ncbi:hypothetical protein GQX74_003030 [Glossina fuscipes]|nr:hypothetical protein GQX74_003030 [Glossina fuscipes]
MYTSLAEEREWELFMDDNSSCLSIQPAYLNKETRYIMHKNLSWQRRALHKSIYYAIVLCVPLSKQ